MRKAHYKSILLAILSGVLYALALPGFSLSFLSWTALIPLLFAIEKKQPKHAFCLGLLSGSLTAMLVLTFLPSTFNQLGLSVSAGMALLALLIVYFGLYIATFSALIVWLQKGTQRQRNRERALLLTLFLIPSVWVMQELIHVHLLKGIPLMFLLLGYSQWNTLPVIQFADITGVYGVSFLILLVNVALFRMVQERSRREPAIAMTVLLLCLTYGFWRMSPYGAPTEGEKHRVAILQGNMNSHTKLNKTKGKKLATRYLQLNEQANATNPDLVVWTETAIPWPIHPDDDLVSESLERTFVSKASHIIGNPFPAEGDAGKYYNAAFFIMPNGEITGIYKKMKLLALTETRLIPWFHLGADPYTPGEKLELLHTPHGVIGINICNENLYPGLVRKSVQKGADYIVNMSNDAWTPSIRPIRLHYVQNIFRAIENRRETVVASNIGISGFIDACGRTKIRSTILEEICLTGEVRETKSSSVYTTSGDLFAYLCSILSVGWIIVCSVASRHRHS